MNLASLSIKRPIFISCIVILMLAVGLLSMWKLPVDLFPDVNFPVVMVNIPYPGAGPEEVETLIARPVEEQLGTLSGMQQLRSINKEGFSTIIAKFSLETDIKDAEQRIRALVGAVRSKLPADIKEPVITRIDPADVPIQILSLTADLPPGELYDLANDVVKPKLEQVANVGLVEILGGRKREIQVQIDRRLLKAYEISATQVSARVGASGQNVPAGKVNEGPMETVFRTLAQFTSLDDIRKTIVNFMGNDRPVTINDLGVVVDGLTDEKSKSYYNGKNSLLLMIFRQSGANTVAVADAVNARVIKLDADLKHFQNREGKAVPAEVRVVRNGAKYINYNLVDVEESIFFGITLTILVVFLFLGNIRSTLITGMALPNSLIGAFILMSAAGFSINVMSLLALSLTVGLLIDDAIVVRENIFRYMEMGHSPKSAALNGTKEVTMAVVATTLTVIAVFGPIGFLSGTVGQFFKQFGLTICFAMAISLFDALTVAPMMSAYLGGVTHSEKKGLFYYTLGYPLRAFDRFQTHLENFYEKTLKFSMKFPMVILLGALGIFIASIVALKNVPNTFLPAQDNGEFGIDLDMMPGTSLEKMAEVALKIDDIVRANKEVEDTILIVGNRDGESNVAQFFVNLIPAKQRDFNTSQMKDKLREQLKEFQEVANPKVKDVDMVGGGMRPFNFNISGPDLAQIEDISKQVYAKIKDHPALKDPDISFRPGKPEFQAVIDRQKAALLGVSSAVVGNEIRNLVEGVVPAVYREQGREYDIRVRLQEPQRNLRDGYAETYVPNINNSLIRLSSIAQAVETKGPANILRQDRGRYVQISADIAPNGPGMGGLMQDINTLFQNEIKLPPGVTYSFVGQAEDFKDLQENMAIAMGLGILFIYLVLASLYESVVTPFTIMLVLPLAACGAFFGLLITGKSLDIFSMIGCVMLLGIATKNSILLVDYANQLIAGGMERSAAIIKAGTTRLRPILMTTFALIAGMLPVAYGLNEASRQRTSMGVAVIGGLISSTLLTLLVVPAAFSYIDRFRKWAGLLVQKLVGYKPEPDDIQEQTSSTSNKVRNGHSQKDLRP